MLPIDTFSLPTAIGVEAAGQIFLPTHNGIEDARLAFAWQGRLFTLRLAGDATLAFKASDTDGSLGAGLVITGARLEVDPASALTGTAGVPRAGSAFLNPQGGGFIGRMGHADGYITLAGEMMPGEPEWGRGFISFRRWRLVVDLPTPGQVYVVAERGEG